MSNLIQSNSSEVSFPDNIGQQQFLKFLLHPETKVVLPIQQITEVLKIPLGQIVPIPQMPPWVMGVHNWRGNILWMIDLGHLVGLESWYQHQVNYVNYTAIVLSPPQQNQDHLQQINLGLVVAQVEDLETCALQDIQAALNSTIAPQVEQFLQGYWLKPEGEMILVLDGQAIAAAMPTSPSQ